MRKVFVDWRFIPIQWALPPDPSSLSDSPPYGTGKRLNEKPHLEAEAIHIFKQAIEKALKRANAVGALAIQKHGAVASIEAASAFLE